MIMDFELDSPTDEKRKRWGPTLAYAPDHILQKLIHDEGIGELDRAIIYIRGELKKRKESRKK